MTQNTESWIEEADRLRRRFEDAAPIDKRPVMVEYVGTRRVVNREADEKQRRQSIDITRRNRMFREAATLIGDRPDIAAAAGVAECLDPEKPVRGWWEIVKVLTGDDPHIGTADELDAGKTELLSAEAIGKLIAAARRPVKSLTPRARNVLHELLRREVFCIDSRVSLREVVKQLHSHTKDENDYKPVQVELKQRGLIDAKPGRGGGIWLTTEGQDRAKSLPAKTSKR